MLPNSHIILAHFRFFRRSSLSLWRAIDMTTILLSYRSRSDEVPCISHVVPKKGAEYLMAYAGAGASRTVAASQACRAGSGGCDRSRIRCGGSICCCCCCCSCASSARIAANISARSLARRTISSRLVAAGRMCWPCKAADGQNSGAGRSDSGAHALPTAS